MTICKHKRTIAGLNLGRWKKTRKNSLVVLSLDKAVPGKTEVLYFAAAATSGGFFVLLLNHNSGFATGLTSFRFASSFLGCATFIAFENSHTCLLLLIV